MMQLKIKINKKKQTVHCSYEQYPTLYVFFLVFVNILAFSSSIRGY